MKNTSLPLKFFLNATFLIAAVIGGACSFDTQGITTITDNDNNNSNSQNNNNSNSNNNLNNNQNNNNSNTNPVCGNEFIEGGEVCDGDNLNGQTCQTLSYEGGVLRCASDCMAFDISSCEGPGPECGDGLREGVESCDGSDLGGATCGGLGYDGGQLGCTGSCEFDESGCYECGDGVINATEVCDGMELGGATCGDLGYDGGQLGCTGSCEFDESGCYECGDGVINGTEVCDGMELGGASCNSLGLQSGDLGCLADCSGYDTSECLFSSECASVSLPVSGYNEVIITATSINGGDNVAFLTAGESFSLTVSYSIEDCDCPGCRDQIEIGFVPGENHSYCAYDGAPGCGSPDTGQDTETLNAPMTPGYYEIRFGRRQDYGCFYTDENWWDGTPPESRTIGAICVTN